VRGFRGGALLMFFSRREGRKPGSADGGKMWQYKTRIGRQAEGNPILISM